jgi:tetratricopeptide (TPR) repeat protein
MMGDETRPLESRTLGLMMEARDFKANQLARALGIDPKTFYQILKGRPAPSPALLEEAAAVMDLPSVVVPRSMDYLRRLDEARELQAAHAAGEDAGDLEIDRLATEMALALEAPLRAGMRRWHRRMLAYGERLVAPALWERLQKYDAAQRKGVVQQVKAFRSAGLVELLCRKSIQAAADDADQAVELAGLACLTAEQVQGTPAQRANAQSQAWGHLGNARRVQGDLPAAAEAFARSAVFQKAGAGDDSGLFDATCLLDLEASLRRAQRDLPAALALLDRALAADPIGPRAGRILIIRAKTLEEMDDYEEAIATLRRALPLVDGKSDPRLPLTLRYNLAENLFQVGRFAEAEPLLPGVQELAERLGNRLDLVRYVWFGARIDAGLDRPEKAEAGFQQVRRDFLARGIAFDAALASLELAVLYLEQGRSAEVREIAAELLPVFKAQKVDREALATVHLFCDAARQETLTAEMARGYLKKLRKAGRPSPPAPKQA